MSRWTIDRLSDADDSLLESSFTYIYEEDEASCIEYRTLSIRDGKKKGIILAKTEVIIPLYWFGFDFGFCNVVVDVEYDGILWGFYNLAAADVLFINGPAVEYSDDYRTGFIPVRSLFKFDNVYCVFSGCISTGEVVDKIRESIRIGRYDGNFYVYDEDDIHSHIPAIAELSI